ncbi:TolC family protein [Croceicoccus naphthovorans]|uniref:Uncharacterized protein n=2 Tax=Croceicoccus naphthovorans TaxID=1348774 RepID=A0A0G3XE18_9SPHN|nr:TolC family protein [Croceicoccus naphthovorans]AKM09442.1 hypothetical protein AB433_04725 [Croceicoccus naphthovorans]
MSTIVGWYDSTLFAKFWTVWRVDAGWPSKSLCRNAGVSARERIARIARLRYREGVADYLEVLDAERNLYAARQQLLMTQRAYLRTARRCSSRWAEG